MGPLCTSFGDIRHMENNIATIITEQNELIATQNRELESNIKELSKLNW